MSERSPQAADHRIAVGVDGSPSARAALAWAAGQAELTGATVEAVIAWRYPAVVCGGPFAPFGVLMDADFVGAAATVLSTAISQAVDPASPVKVSSTVREGNPAQILIEAADGADLLVVGSRGHGGFAEALLGSVGQQCVQHARCPVVIVRGPVGLTGPV